MTDRRGAVDDDNSVARSFGLVYETLEMMELCRTGREVCAMDGTGAWELPVPATWSTGRDDPVCLLELDLRRGAEPRR